MGRVVFWGLSSRHESFTEVTGIRIPLGVNLPTSVPPPGVREELIMPSLVVPDYVPAPIAEFIYANKLAGIKGLAKRAKLSYTVTCFTFRESKHEAFFAFLELCKTIKAEPEEVAIALSLPAFSRRERLKFLIYRSWASCEQLYNSGKACDQYVQGMMRGECGKKINKIYVPLANTCGVALAELGVMFQLKKAA